MDVDEALKLGIETYEMCRANELDVCLYMTAMFTLADGYATLQAKYDALVDKLPTDRDGGMVIPYHTKLRHNEMPEGEYAYAYAKDGNFDIWVTNAVGGEHFIVGNCYAFADAEQAQAEGASNVV